MDDMVNQNNVSQGNPANAPVMRKIKRPIKRPVQTPLGAAPMAPNAGGQAGNMPRLKKIKRPIKRPIFQPMNGRPLNENPAEHLQAGATPAADDSLDFGLPNITEPLTNLDDEVNNLLDTPTEPEVQPSNLPEKVTKPQFNQQEHPRFINEQDLKPAAPASSFIQGDLFTKQAVGLVALVMMIVGFVMAKVFFTEETIVRDGLQGVIVNPEVPKGRARCGIAERTQGCVLYIMNPQRQDLRARDFYDLASQLTGRQRFVIETGNMRYSNTKISPGEIVQLNIPPLQ